jgi:hypothetical protein
MKCFQNHNILKGRMQTNTQELDKMVKLAERTCENKRTHQLPIPLKCRLEL